MCKLPHPITRSVGDSLSARKFLAEFVGTFVLVVFAIAAAAQATFIGAVHDGYLRVPLGYGLGAMFGTYVAAGVSGGHLNPAVTVAWALLKRTSWSVVPLYLSAQYLGSLCAAAAVYSVYYDALNHYDGGVRLTNPEDGNASAAIFASYPLPFLSWQTGLVDQILATCCYVIVLLSVVDPRNPTVEKETIPFLVGILLTTTSVSFKLNSGCTVNPAKDLAPRFFTWVCGWGNETFSHRDFGWFWIPVIGPHLGALMGATAYQVFIGSQQSSKRIQEAVEKE